MESTQNKKYFDFLVIGGGSGGLGAARRAAMFGKRVAMVENKAIGGTCVNVGCVPKKIMFNVANFLEDTHLFKDYGVEGVENARIDFASFKKNRDAYIERLHGIYHKNVAGSNVEYIQGTARFVGQKEVEVEGIDAKSIITADHVMIASGSKSLEAKSLEGAEHCITSDAIFEMDTLPKRMVIIGGGYIGTEIAGIMNAFGVETTLLVRDMMLARVDQEVVDMTIENMKKQGIKIHLYTEATKILKDPSTGELTLKLNKGGDLKADKVLLALGRVPNTDALNLKEMGINLEPNGAVAVDKF